jgi:hypothetical protein
LYISDIPMTWSHSSTNGIRIQFILMFLYTDGNTLKSMEITLQPFFSCHPDVFSTILFAESITNGLTVLVMK